MLNRQFMSLNVLSRTEILDVDIFTSVSTHYSYKRKLIVELLHNIFMV
jgi:hypothetical protein